MGDPESPHLKHTSTYLIAWKGQTHALGAVRYALGLKLSPHSAKHVSTSSEVAKHPLPLGSKGQNCRHSLFLHFARASGALSKIGKLLSTLKDYSQLVRQFLPGGARRCGISDVSIKGCG